MPHKEMNAPFGYTTLTNAAYVEWACVMLRSLALSETAYPVKVLCFRDVAPDQRTKLERMGPDIETIPIDPIELPANVRIRHRAWEIAFSRLRMFELTQFEKMIYLDGDMVVLQNLDSLFEEPCLAASSHHYPLRPNGINLNAGLALFRPNRDVYRQIVEEIVHLPSPLAPHTWERSDQEVLIALYSQEEFAARWRAEHGIRLDEHWNLLDYRYNAITGLRERQHTAWNAREAKVLHYTCGPKPWRRTRSVGTDQDWTERVWWDFHASMQKAARDRD